MKKKIIECQVFLFYSLRIVKVYTNFTYKSQQTSNSHLYKLSKNFTKYHSPDTDGHKSEFSYLKIPYSP